LNIKTWMTKNKALGDVGVYYVSTAINQAVPFLLLPVITVYLLPGDFGFINTFSALLVLATSVFSGLSVSINKHFYSKNREYNRLLIGNLYLILVIGTILIFLLSLALMIFFNISFIPESYFLAIPLITFFCMSSEFLKNLFKTSKRPVAFAVLTFSEVMVNVSISLILVIGLSWHWQGRVVGIMLSTVIFGLVSLLFLIFKEKIMFTFSTEMIREILKVALPFIPLGLSVMIMRRSGVLFIDSSLGKVEAGLYGVAMNLATVILFLSVPLINVWTPYLYEKLARSRNVTVLIPLYHKLLLLSLGTFFLSLLFSLFSGQVLDLMTTAAFAQAGRFIPWLAFGFCMWVMTALLTPFLVHFNRQKLIALIASGGAAVNLALNYYLIGRFGSIGAAVSFFIANLLSALIMFATVRHIGKLPFIPSSRLLLKEAQGVIKWS
jgi:O-antigen/teichoic acid export membrane protein